MIWEWIKLERRDEERKKWDLNRGSVLTLYSCKRFIYWCVLEWSRYNKSREYLPKHSQNESDLSIKAFIGLIEYLQFIYQEVEDYKILSGWSWSLTERWYFVKLNIFLSEGLQSNQLNHEDHEISKWVSSKETKTYSHSDRFLHLWFVFLSIEVIILFT